MIATTTTSAPPADPGADLPGRMSPRQAAALTRRITWMSLATAAVLVLAKAMAWLASDSVALLASAADSGLDLLASAGTFFAVRYAAAPPDAEHRYGHGKAEAFASLMQAGLVFASAALVGQEAIHHLIRPTTVQGGLPGVAVMLLSLVLTFLLVTAQKRVLKQTSSVAIAGDRAHYLMDFAANVAALAGVAAAAFLGLAWVDAVAGLVIAALLLWGAIGVFRQSSAQLMDRELSDAARSEIVALMIADGGVRGVHQLRTRASGPYVHIQMHADLDPELSLQDAHKVMVAAEKRVLDAFPAADIIIHPDPRGHAEPHGGAFAEEVVADPAR
jgi:cation diffusion facilitator family transporter